MKRHLFLVFALIATASYAQTLDARVKAAVDDLAFRVTYSGDHEVFLDPITVGDSDSVSAFSAFLSAKVMHYLLASWRGITIVAPTRGLSVVKDRQWHIGGSFAQNGADVVVTLVLWYRTRKENSRSFTVPVAEIEALNIAILPDNKDSVADLDSARFDFYPSSFAIAAWCDSDTRTYYDGDKMTISMEADANCFVKVYQIDINGKVQVIYPNSTDKNNAVKSKKVRTIPEKTSFVLGAPYGEETILVVASKKQFADVTDTAIPASAVATAKFTYTILPANMVSDVLSYPIPAVIPASTVIKELKKYVESQGGTFSGDNSSGTFALRNETGTYPWPAAESRSP